MNMQRSGWLLNGRDSKGGAGETSRREDDEGEKMRETVIGRAL